jgi:hypothetical protein
MPRGEQNGSALEMAEEPIQNDEGNGHAEQQQQNGPHARLSMRKTILR